MTIRTLTRPRVLWSLFCIIAAASCFVAGVAVFAVGGVVGLREWHNGLPFAPGPMALLCLGAGIVLTGQVPMGMRPTTDAAMRMLGPRFVRLMKAYFMDMSMLVTFSGTAGFLMAISYARGDANAGLGWFIIAASSGGIWWMLGVVDRYLDRAPKTVRSDARG